MITVKIITFHKINIQDYSIVQTFTNLEFEVIILVLYLFTLLHKVHMRLDSPVKMLVESLQNEFMVHIGR